MTRRIAAVAMLVIGLALPGLQATAQDRITLGWGRMATNDALGDGRDRWRTGSYTVSRVRGLSWSGDLPHAFGELLEFRGRAEVIAPEYLAVLPPGDRRYAGVLSVGVHTHFDMAGFDASLGADLAATGPQTRMSEIQQEIHDLIGYPPPLVAANQIPNGVYPTLVAEVGRSVAVSGQTTLRPFVEAQAGLESFVRAGFDLSVGGYSTGALMLRDHVSGQRYRAIAGSLTPGLSFTLGGDIARVFDSALLPEDGAVQLSDTRSRLRMGMAWQGERASAFYGVTMLGEEFETQREEQIVGSVSLQLRF